MTSVVHVILLAIWAQLVLVRIVDETVISACWNLVPFQFCMLCLVMLLFICFSELWSEKPQSSYFLIWLQVCEAKTSFSSSNHFALAQELIWPCNPEFLQLQRQWKHPARKLACGKTSLFWYWQAVMSAFINSCNLG